MSADAVARRLCRPSSLSESFTPFSAPPSAADLFDGRKSGCFGKVRENLLQKVTRQSRFIRLEPRLPQIEPRLCHRSAGLANRAITQWFSTLQISGLATCGRRPAVLVARRARSRQCAGPAQRGDAPRESTERTRGANRGAGRCVTARSSARSGSVASRARLPRRRGARGGRRGRRANRGTESWRCTLAGVTTGSFDVSAIDHHAERSRAAGGGSQARRGGVQQAG